MDKMELVKKIEDILKTFGPLSCAQIANEVGVGYKAVYDALDSCYVWEEELTSARGGKKPLYGYAGNADVDAIDADIYEKLQPQLLLDLAPPVWTLRTAYMPAPRDSGLLYW
jgi:hypothetical protein